MKSSPSKLIEVLVLFVGFAFLAMWADQFVYKNASLRDSYSFLMFGLAAMLGYVYLRGMRVAKEQADKPSPPPPSSKKTPQKNAKRK